MIQNVWRSAAPILPLLLAATLAHGQSACSSDDQPAPTLLFERFINADCDACWRDSNTAAAPPKALVLDWIVPGSQGEDAALAAAASSDALARLASQQQPRPTTQSQRSQAVANWPGLTLRVAHGPAVNNYVGMSVSLTLPANSALAWPLSGWVLLVENLPSGTEGSPRPRNLIRNALQPLWNKGQALSNQETISLEDFRAMSLPEGTKTNRLQLLGWVQDAQGQVLAAASSLCPKEETSAPSDQTR
ncbi:hypothetical protein [Rhodoferax fermentans]|uniref:Uncharacterized protein n=1 Tax=Rhodoferax fermentans TaxID=28066 RepID=A0A1T1AQ86_RHOFE|nr:hypothetical protein [Rhodoferax fermentans]MBK1685457.1 hypothetical protein [Rhodoferax fermentans]OOV06217.1 hypothetical protein RF819_05290 [Rhodoferax fermentans]